MPLPSVLVFDVNETLLDLAGLDGAFGEVFGGEGRRVREAWFAELLQQALTSTITGAYLDFGGLAKSALRVTARREGKDLREADVEQVLAAVRHLPPHDDVVPALDQLEADGFRLAALSNGTPAALQAQMQNSGLADRFEVIASADAAGRLKPAPDPYHRLAHRLDLPPSDLCMVAAHAWDTTGALRAGLQAIFVQRPGKHLGPAHPEPLAIIDTLMDLPDALGHAV
jgi:2-haloacid dehalogenase